MAAIGDGSLVVMGWRNDFSAAPGFAFERIEGNQLRGLPSPPPFPTPIKAFGLDGRSSAEWRIDTGLWFLVVAYLLIWLGMVFWWQRWKRKRLKEVEL
jgi:hypothetical protein